MGSAKQPSPKIHIKLISNSTKRMLKSPQISNNGCMSLCIAITSDECRGVANYRQLDCLFKSSLNLPVTDGPVMRKAFPCHGFQPTVPSYKGIVRTDLINLTWDAYISLVRKLITTVQFTLNLIFSWLSAIFKDNFSNITDHSQSIESFQMAFLYSVASATIFHRRRLDPF